MPGSGEAEDADRSIAEGAALQRARHERGGIDDGVGGHDAHCSLLIEARKRVTPMSPAMMPTIQNRSVIFSSSQPLQLVVVVQRAHPEDPLAVGQLEVADLDDHRQRLDHEHEPDDRQDQDLARDEGGHRERRAERERPRVAHEYLRRVDVEPQEPEQRRRR